MGAWERPAPSPGWRDGDKEKLEQASGGLFEPWRAGGGGGPPGGVTC